jgi:trk system potassium uptake protein TrkA
VLPTATAIEWVDPSAQVSLVERQIDPSNAGRTYADIESSSDVKVIAVSRLGAATLVSANLVAQEGDLMYLAVASDAVDRLDTVLARPAVHGH